jgi:RHS repeat-associated protein
VKSGQQVRNAFFFDSAKRWRTEQGPTDSPGFISYAYIGTGRLYADSRETTTEAPQVAAPYDYDAPGQRKTSVVSKDGAQTTTDFTYTGLTLHKLSASQTQGETSETWSITYLYDEYGRPYAGVYRDTTSTENPPAPTVFALVTTDRGDVVGLLDSNGDPFAAYRYDAWGNPLGAGTDGAAGMWWQTTALITDVNLAEAIAQRQVLRYAGYCYDSESGLYYLSARHYDPATRQFLSKDLSRNDGEQSAYQYCLGNPVGLVDPTGLEAWYRHFWNGAKSVGRAVDKGVGAIYNATCPWAKDNYWKNQGYKETTLSKVVMYGNPVYGVVENGYGTGEAIKRGDAVGALVGVGMIGVDVVTGGKGSLLKNGIKGGAELALSRGAKELAEEGLETGVKRGGVYTLRDEAGNVVRTGRTNDFVRREAEHYRDPLTRPYQFSVERPTDNLLEQKGLEMQLYGLHPEALLENGGLNKIRPVSLSNPNLPVYEEAARGLLARMGLL